MQKKLLILAVLALVLIGGAVFVWQKKQSGEAIAPVTIVKPEVAQNESYPQYIEAIAGTDEAWYNIPEIGVRMRLNKEFATSLIYQYSRVVTDSKEEWDAVDFSTKELIAIDTGCSPKEGRPLGSITKWEKDLQESAKNNNDYFFSGLNNIQIGDDYYVWIGPQSTCWNPKNDEAIEKVRSPEVYRSIQDGVKTLQLILSK